jgi:hypothetical protein
MAKDKWADRDYVLKAVKEDGEALKRASKSLRANREFMLEAVRQDGWALEYADESLQADREFVLEAVKLDGSALKYADGSLRADRKVVLAAVKDTGHALQYAAKSLKADRKVVLAAIKLDGSALQYADESLRADREVVLAAVKDTGHALKYADDSLKADREVVLAAVKKRGRALEWAAKSLWADRKREAEIESWCKKHDLPTKEVAHLANADEDRAHKFIELFIGESLIPRSELNWAAEKGADELIKGYLQSRLFAQVGAENFDGPLIIIAGGKRVNHFDVNYNNWWEVGALHEYEPERGRNNVPEHTRRILYKFKPGNPQITQDYADKLNAIIAPDVVICCVPSHLKDRWGPGLEIALDKLGRLKNRRSCPHLLRRTENTQKRSSPGSNRSIERNLRTIEVTDKASIKDCPVVVIDDVTTTGNSMKACSKLLWDSGCNCVGAIALGRTTSWGNPSRP